MRVIIRTFAGGAQISREEIVIEEATLTELVHRLVVQHAAALAATTVDMIEMEFPTMPQEERYFRLGTNLAGMVVPLKII